MAITNTISYYLQTGEWMELGCKQTLSPYNYVFCFKPDMVNGKDQLTVVLHPNTEKNGKILKQDGDHDSFEYDIGKRVILLT